MSKGTRQPRDPNQTPDQKRRQDELAEDLRKEITQALEAVANGQPIEPWLEEAIQKAGLLRSTDLENECERQHRAFRNCGILEGIEDPKKRAFLTAYAHTGNISVAVRHAGISRQTHHNWLKADPLYAEAAEKAKEIAGEILEEEAFRRAYYGVPRKVFQRGKHVDTVRDYDNILLIFLMKGTMPQKYRERIEHSGQIAGSLEGVAAAARRYLSNRPKPDQPAIGGDAPSSLPAPQPEGRAPSRPSIPPEKDSPGA